MHVDPGDTPNAHNLTQEGIDRIDGLGAWLDGARATLQPLIEGLDGNIGTGDGTYYRDGNIIMGGDGNDQLTGRGGYDIIDGDAYLNVRIRIVVDGVTYSAESLSTDTTLMGPNAGKVYNTNPDGSPNFASPAFGGRSLQSLLLDRTINPGEMSIVREILTDNTNVSGAGRNIDTVIFQGSRAEYDIEGQTETTQEGDTALSYIGSIEDVDGDGFISITDRDTGTGATFFQIVDGVATEVTNAVRRDAAGKIAVDDMDLIKNIERLQFSDVTFSLERPKLDLNSATGGNNHTATFTENGAAVAIGSLPAITTENGSILSAYIVLTDFQAGDVISVAGGLPGGIVAGPVINNGNFLSIELTGSASPADYQAAIGLIRFSNTSDAPGDASRTIEVTVSDAAGASLPATATVTVIAVNDPLVAVADTIISNATGAFTVAEWALVANDIDPDGPLPLDILFANVSGTSLASASLVTNPGSVTITDNGNTVATAGGSFVYNATDGGGGFSNALATVVTQGRSNYADNFNNGGAGTVRSPVNGSTGGTAWTSSWTEAGEAADLLAGRAQIDGGANNGSNQMRFATGAGTVSFARNVNLAGLENATLSFDVDQNNLDAGETLTVEFDANGDGTFETVLATIGSRRSVSLHHYNGGADRRDRQLGNPLLRQCLQRGQRKRIRR